MIEIGTVLGEGEYGIINQGYLNGIPVAVKSAKDPNYSLANEGFLQSQVRHLHVVDVLDFNDKRIVMEHCNSTLEGFSSAYRPRTSDASLSHKQYLNEVLKAMKDNLKALEYVHSLGILHRDVKPGNIFLDNEGRLIKTGKLGDFGSASRLEDLVEGKIPPSEWFYQAPEVEEGFFGPKNDVYSAGVALVHTLRGEEVFEDVPWEDVKNFENYNHEQIMWHLEKAAKEYDEVGLGDDVRRIGEKMLEFEYDARASTTEAVEAIIQVLN